MSEKSTSLLFSVFGVMALLLALGKIVIHLQFVYIPLFFFLIGFLLYLWNRKKSFLLFLFFLPLINSLPDLFFIGYSYNYLATALFYLAGMYCCSIWQNEPQEFFFPGMRIYLLFLTLLWVSFFFVFLRWSNLTLSLQAFFRDTPVSASGQRLSFASIFPVFTLFLFSTGPWLVPAFRRSRLALGEVFNKALLPGISFSVAIAAVQHFFFPDFLSQKWWSESLHRTNGGFSDFNGLGLFAGICFFYSGSKLLNDWFLSPRSRRMILKWSFFCLTALAGIVFSGSRTAFFFVLAGTILLVFNKKIQLRHRVASGIILVLLFLTVGGTLKSRIFLMAEQFHILFKGDNVLNSVNEISNGRVDMLLQSVPLVSLNPFSGVGAGNFLFAFQTVHFGKNYYEDMPLNQYLLILNEMGIIGLLVFCGFLFFLLRETRVSLYWILLLIMMFIFFFGNPLWLPEGMILFWLLISGLEIKKKSKIKHGLISWVLISVFLISNVLTFSRLHPMTWLTKKGIPYDYGFWYSEKNSFGEEFRWSRAAAGVYLPFSDVNTKFNLTCGAPLDSIRGRKQVVRIYWRGRFIRAIEFRTQSEHTLSVDQRGYRGGFLEIRVHPAFNLKKLGLGDETRTLGVQFSTDSSK